MPSRDPVTVVDAAEDGRFRVALEPGSYELCGENVNGGAVPSAMPVPVDVTAGEFTEVTVQFDSGMR